MSKDRIFRFRMTDEQREQLQGEADERGLTKADRVRDALGWPLADRAPQLHRPASPRRGLATPVPDTVVDPDLHPGRSAMQQIAQKLAKGS
jgi:hypothetical protein